MSTQVALWWSVMWRRLQALHGLVTLMLVAGCGDPAGNAGAHRAGQHQSAQSPSADSVRASNHVPISRHAWYSGEWLGDEFLGRVLATRSVFIPLSANRDRAVVWFRLHQGDDGTMVTYSTDFYDSIVRLYDSVAPDREGMLVLRGVADMPNDTLERCTGDTSRMVWIHHEGDRRCIDTFARSVRPYRYLLARLLLAGCRSSLAGARVEFRDDTTMIVGRDTLRYDLGTEFDIPRIDYLRIRTSKLPAGWSRTVAFRWITAELFLYNVATNSDTLWHVARQPLCRLQRSKPSAMP